MALPRKTKQDKANDNRISVIYGRECSGVQIPMLEIPNIFRRGREAIAAGADDAALAKTIIEYVAAIRCN